MPKLVVNSIKNDKFKTIQAFELKFVSYKISHDKNRGKKNRYTNII